MFQEKKPISILYIRGLTSRGRCWQCRGSSLSAEVGFNTPIMHCNKYSARLTTRRSLFH